MNPKQDGYTEIPDEVLDEYMKKLTPSEFKILIFLYRRLFGCIGGKGNISIEEFMNRTSLSKQTVIAAVRKLEEEGIISKNRYAQESKMGINEFKLAG